MQILCFDQKIRNNLKHFCDWKMTPQSIESMTFVSPNGSWYRCATGVLSVRLFSEILLFIEATDYRSNFAKTILFENCSCFSKIPFIISQESPRIFQCLISIPAGHWVGQIDGDLLRRFFWSALLSLVINMTGRSERSARALRDGADVVCEAVGNEFCVRICYMFLISKCRGDRDLGLCPTSVLALGERMRDGKIRGKKRVSTQEKSDFVRALRFFKRKYRSCAQT